MTNQTKECPQTNVLLSFLQGKLHPPHLEECESHLKDCQLCHETLVGLSSDDTLSQRIVVAMEADSTGGFELDLSASNPDSIEVNSLLNRLTSDDFKRHAMQSPAYNVINSGIIDSEIIADRAAEVLRCVTADENSLGVLGDYTLQRLIGAGSTSVVFQALDQKLDRTVALKVLRPSLGKTARQRFLVEARLAASIEHVNVVTIFQVGQVDRLAYIAMPWLPGQTLESMLASGEPLEKDRIAQIINQVSAGLSAAHKRQLVHRDIKPANLWICEEDNQLKILDFGLARISDDDPNLTATGMLAGTPNFMSPEQTRGMELDGRSDLFSLGCVLYRLLTGKLPFAAPTILATLTSIQNDHPIPPNQLSPNVNNDLSDLTMCLLEKQPANRPQSATQTIELLSTPRDQWPIAIKDYSDSQTTDPSLRGDRAANASAMGAGKNRTGWFRSAIVAVGLMGLGTLGWLLAPQIIRIVTEQAEVVIETEGENVEVQVLKDGKQVTTTRAPKLEKRIQSGEASSDLLGSLLDDSQSPQSREDLTHPPEKPFYKGESFSGWFRIAKLDRDPQTQSNAMKACAATAETDDEREKLLKLVQLIVRRYESTVNGLDSTSNRYQGASMEVLKRCTTDRVLQFYKTEIADGNLESRNFCQRWLTMTANGGHLTLLPHSHPKRQRVEAIKNRILELEEVIASNFQSPGVFELFKALIPEGDGAEEILKKLRCSKVAAEVKEMVISGDFRKRLLLLGTAVNLLRGDEEIFQIYREHLLQPNIPVNKLPKNMMTNASRLRTQLFTGLTALLFSEDDSSAASTSDPEPSQRRAKLGAELLLAVTDGLMANNGDRLEFMGLLRSSSIGGLKGGGVSKGQHQHCFTEDLLPVFYEVSKRLKDKEVKQQLLEKTQAYKKWLFNELRKSDRETFSKAFLNIDYLIGYISDSFLDPTFTPAPDPTLIWSADYWEGGYNDGMDGGFFGGGIF